MKSLALVMVLFSSLPLLAQIRCPQAQRMSFFDSMIGKANLPVSLDRAGFDDGTPIVINVNRDNPNYPVLEVGDKKLSLHDGPYYVDGRLIPGRVEAKIERIDSHTLQVSNRIFSHANIRLLSLRRNVVVRLNLAQAELTRATVTTFTSTRMVVDGATQERPIEQGISQKIYSKRP